LSIVAHTRVTRWIVAVVALAASCGRSAPEAHPAAAPAPASHPVPTVTLTFAAFATPREAYEKRIIPKFKDLWRRTHGEQLEIRASYLGSGSQVRAILDGAEPDVAALSLAEHLDQLAQAGRIRKPWRDAPHGGVVCRSIVVIAVRKGNPEKIQGWPDLARPGLEILTPDPMTSGGGRWNVCAVFGSTLRGHAGVAAGDRAAAERMLASVLGNVIARDRDARESFKSFEEGTGDVALTTESEVVRGRMFGHDYESVIPESTLQEDNPAALLDAHADAHGVRAVAEAFLEYLWTPEAQEAFAFYGFRSIDLAVADAHKEQYPSIPDLWTIEDLGGWDRASAEIFGADGVLARAMAAQAKK
jgi:sulfate transport system substrate-binding protein